MDRALLPEHPASVPVNWLAAATALGAASLLASFWLAYGTPLALVAALGLTLYGAVVPLQLPRFVFSRGAFHLAVRLTLFATVAILFVNVVGGATESANVAVSVVASLVFIAGLLAVLGFAARAIIGRAVTPVRRAPGRAVALAAMMSGRIGLYGRYVRESYFR
jgi:hypothetical protein